MLNSGSGINSYVRHLNWNGCSCKTDLKLHDYLRTSSEAPKVFVAGF